MVSLRTAEQLVNSAYSPPGERVGRRPVDLLCSPNARPLKTRARANGRSREIDCEAIGG
jgi:hypothetical protein